MGSFSTLLNREELLLKQGFWRNRWLAEFSFIYQINVLRRIWISPANRISDSQKTMHMLLYVRVEGKYRPLPLPISSLHSIRPITSKAAHPPDRGRLGANIFGVWSTYVLCSTYLFWLLLLLGTAGTTGSIGLALLPTYRCLLLGTATGGGLLLGSGGLGHRAVEQMAFKNEGSGGRLARAPAAIFFASPTLAAPSRACRPLRTQRLRTL